MAGVQVESKSPGDGARERIDAVNDVDTRLGEGRGGLRMDG